MCTVNPAFIVGLEVPRHQQAHAAH